MLLQPIRWLVWLAGRGILSLRYRVHVTGLAEVRQHPGPYLILPNHPAYADPPNLIVRLWAAFRARPILLGSVFRNPLLAPFAFLLRAIEVPDLAEVTAAGRQQTEAALQAVVQALRAGETVVMWPSGRLMRDGTERVGANRGVSDVLAAVPNVTVVLVRTRGLWGSMFSWAYTGQRPPLMKRLLQGAGLILANLIVFTPRRHVSVTLEAFPPDRRPEPTREAINPWLDEWYNRDQNPEKPTFVPYHFLFGPRSYEFPKPAPAPVFDFSKVKPQTKQIVAEILSDKLRRPVGDMAMSPQTTFMQIGLDSLDAMEVELEIENRFGFTGGDVPTTIGHLWALAEGMIEKAPPKPPPAAWFRPPSGTMTIELLGETVPEAVLNRVRHNPRDIATADDLSGVLTYEKLLVGATALADRFRRLPGDHVGLLLPASTAGVVSLIALHLARKVPVILNWTTGPANLSHAVKLLGVTNVITSRKFVDRTQIEVPGAEYVYLEDLRASIHKLEQLRRLLAVRYLPGWTMRRWQTRSHRQPSDTAVVLFTSGSEKAPKAVPLTHANVLSDLRGALPLLDLDRTHSALVFLPLFHSFGHTVTGLLPILGGVKVVYHPDPTDAAGLVRKTALYRPTATAATPTFLGYMLDRAKPGELDSLRIVVVGAEKCPPAVFASARRLAPQAVVLEGYGITECSPVVSVNPLTAPKPGTIGRPIVGVEVRITDLDTGAVLPPGERGMLHISGPNVFPGYIGHDGDPPFREWDGQRWYVTGDLAEIDTDGYLRFHGRLKRFLKAGGEMISLPALEEPFARQYPATDRGPRVAVEGIESPGGRKVVLFTTEDITLKDANDLLLREGFRGVMRLDEVRQVEAIPVLGTGKTDYKVLRAMIG